MTASVAAFDGQKALLGLFQQAVASLLANEVLVSQRPDNINALEGMVERDEQARIESLLEAAARNNPVSPQEGFKGRDSLGGF